MFPPGPLRALPVLRPDSALQLRRPAPSPAHAGLCGSGSAGRRTGTRTRRSGRSGGWLPGVGGAAGGPRRRLPTPPAGGLAAEAARGSSFSCQDGLPPVRGVGALCALAAHNLPRSRTPHSLHSCTTLPGLLLLTHSTGSLLTFLDLF
ncbi:hypothetical protein NDU88_003618 [Pleurodeles waltl]|uniref:Uncharacterized protein n=1 Tax=Pleurodeles waltl TaxID=8319 RepID=A0AAV7SGG1_PLEWA|nr:hypothetical protein NDU88_003618 [Pleurodeles waltl]